MDNFPSAVGQYFVVVNKFLEFSSIAVCGVVVPVYTRTVVGNIFLVCSDDLN